MTVKLPLTSHFIFWTYQGIKKEWCELWGGGGGGARGVLVAHDHYKLLFRVSLICHWNNLNFTLQGFCREVHIQCICRHICEQL